MEICDEILKLDHPIKFKCTTRADNADEEMYQHMKKAGCTTLLLGVESCEPEILKSTKKGVTYDQIIRAIEMIEKVGIAIDASFVIGLPGDTPKSIDKMIALAKRIMRKNNSIACFTMATPFPGTELYELAVKEGFPGTEWGKFDYFHISYVPKSMTKKQLEDSYKKVLRKVYYFNFSYILRRLKRMRNFRQIKINFRYGIRIIKRALNVENLKKAKVVEI